MAATLTGVAEDALKGDPSDGGVLLGLGDPGALIGDPVIGPTGDPLGEPVGLGGVPRGCGGGVAVPGVALLNKFVTIYF